MNLEQVRKEITPTALEHEREFKVVEEVMEVVRGFGGDPVLVGSLAKGTDISGNKDLDIFIRFPPDVPRRKLESEGLKIGKKTFKRLGVGYEIDYAEHPYVKGVYSGLNVELVPCYFGGKILSSVDRTPLHNEYVIGRLAKKPLAGDIRLLKQFMKGIGVYGAEAKVEGFSGYLVELLVLYYGCFSKVLEEARIWEIPQVIDPEGLWDEGESLVHFFTDARLVVVDPVDRFRNVAAAVSLECLSKFIVKANEYLEEPSERFFFPEPKPMRSVEELRGLLRSRGTKFVAFVFSHGRLNENTLYSQLRKTTRQVVSDFTGYEFEVFRDSFWTNEADCSVVLVELQVWELPELVHHMGPPIDRAAVHQERFTEKYRDVGPYVKDGRWVVDTPRKYRSAMDLAEKIVGERKGFGKNLRQVEEVRLYEDESLFEIDEEGWLTHLNEYLE